MKPLPLEMPSRSIEISGTRIRNIAKIFAEIITEETAELLDRLAGDAYVAGNTCRGHSDEEDEEAAYALATKIRELLKRKV